MRAAIFMMLVLIFSSGCASFGQSLKAFVRGENISSDVEYSGPRFSKKPNMPVETERLYRRATHRDIASSSGLDENVGSLWVEDGQRSYLFSENQLRAVGDPLRIEIDGDVKKQMESKVHVIRNLLKKIEEPRSSMEGDREDDVETGEGNLRQELDVRFVSTRIVESLPGGVYRVRGRQQFLIRDREYQIVVNAIIRAEDFKDSGVGTDVLLDSQFDIVRATRGG